MNTETASRDDLDQHDKIQAEIAKPKEPENE